VIRSAGTPTRAGETSGRKLVSNAISILASDVVNRASTFVLYVLVGHYLGPRAFGQFSIALALFYIFQVVSGAGMKTFVTRQVARDRTTTDAYLLNGSVVVAFFFLVSIAVLALFVAAMGYPADTATVILLLSLGLLPYSLTTVCEGVFQAHEEMRVD
jgi:O-antigen/teichoic acid export membrane protein